jgi:hypothetical protein
VYPQTVPADAGQGDVRVASKIGHRRRANAYLLWAINRLETHAVGVAFSYSISVTIFGGFAPLVATWLIARTGDPLSPSYYLMATALLSIIALTAIQRRAPVNQTAARPYKPSA